MKIIDRLVRLLFDGFPAPEKEAKPTAIVEPKLEPLPATKEKSGNWYPDSGAAYGWSVKEQSPRLPALYEYWSIQRSGPHELQKAIEFYALSGWHPSPDWQQYTKERGVTLTRAKR